MSALDGMIEATGERQVAGWCLLRCEVCGDQVPVSIEVWCGPDDDGDECLFTDPNVIDLETHMLTHEVVIDADGGSHV